MIDPLVEENDIMLYVLFYSSFAILVGLFAMYLFIMITYFKTNILHIKLIKQMKPFIFGVITILYMPLLDLFFSILHCGNQGQSLFITTLTCWKGIWFLHFVIGLLGIIMTLCLTLVIQPLAYVTGYNAQVPNAKKTGQIDQINAIIKFLTIALYAIVNGTEDEQREWIKIVFTAFAGNYLVYCYYAKSPYYNDLMMKIQLIKAAIYSWANFVILISKVNENVMIGAFYLFLIGLPLLVYMIFTSKNKEKFSFLYPMHQLASEEEIGNQIRALMRMAEERNKERQYLLAIYEYLECQEDSKVAGSPLYNFIHYSENANSSSEPGKYSESVLLYYLYQHIEEVHRYSLAKYPFSSVLLLSYAIFLKDKRGKKKQALIELTKAEQNICTFEEEFFIYRLKKEIIEFGKSDLYHEDISRISKFSRGKSHDVSTMIGYQYNFNIFTTLINQISLAYLNFWTLLLSTQKGIRDNLDSLNEYGVKIHNLFAKIQESFNTLQAIKPNDYQVLSLYSSFLKNIKNDNNQADMYQKLLSNAKLDKHLFEESNLLLLNVASLDTSGYYYAIASGKEDTFELITNISIELCKLLGYRKEELIGKELEILIPDFLRVKHKILIKDKYSNYLQNREISQNKGALKEFKVFAKKQSKYLIPIFLKMGFVPNETEDIFIFSKFVVDEKRAHQCFIMTNSSTTIQHCTSNALGMLNVSSYLFNVNIDIMNFIKEFFEGYVYLQTESNTRNKRRKEIDKEEIKAIVLKEKYIHKKVKVTWRNNILNNSSIQQRSTVKKDNGINSHTSIKRESLKYPIQERILLMTIEEIILNNNKEGYIFGFEAEDMMANQKDLKYQRNSMMTSTQNKKVKQFGYSIAPYNDMGLTTVSNATWLNISEENYLGIEGNFVPEAKTVLFDPNSLSYCFDSNNTVDPAEKLSVVLEKKVRNCFNPRTISSKSVPELSSSSYEDDSDYVLSDKANEEEIEVESSIKEDKKEEKADKEQGGDNSEKYYKVDISKVRFFVYNYKAKQAIEDTSYTKISQLDSKFSKEPQKEFISSFEPQKKARTKTQTHIANAEDNNPKEIFNLDNSSQGTLQLPNKLDSSVLYLRIINSFIVVLFLTIGAVYFILLFSFLEKHKKIAAFISSQSVLLSNMQYMAFFSLEIVLVNNDKYFGFYQQKDEYRAMLRTSLLKTYNESLSLIQTLSTDNSPFADSIRNKTNELKVKVRVLTLPYNFVQYNLSIFDALYEVLACSYSFVNLITPKQIFVNDDFIFILFNNDKTIQNGISRMIGIYKEEHFSMASADRIRMGVFIGVFIVVLSFSFVLIVFGFHKVRKKKKSYLKVFLNINELIIKQSIAKCEVLVGTREHQLLYSNANGNEEDEETTTLSSSSLSRKPLTELEKDQIKADKKEKKTGCFKIYHLIIGLVLLAIVLSIYFFFLDRLTRIRQFSDIYQLFTQNESKYLSLMNSAKLYSMFSTLGLKEINDYRTDLVAFLSNIYPFNADIDANISDSIQLNQFPRNSSIVYEQIFQNNICYYLEQDSNLKRSSLTCENFAGNILSFGLNFVFSYYIDQVRNLKEMVEKMSAAASLSGFNFNEGYYGTYYYDLYLPTDPVKLALYKKLNPFNIFNTEQFKTINLMLINVFNPAFKDVRMSIEVSFENEFGLENKLNWAFMGLYCFVVLFVFISFLVRKERVSNEEVSL